MSNKRNDRGGLVPVGDLFGEIALPKEIKRVIQRQKNTPTAPNLTPGSPVSMRLLETQTHISAGKGTPIWNHTVFCQMGLPLRDPGPERREWQRVNGNVRMKVLAGEALDPKTGEWVQLGLPWGPKVRLVQIYLDDKAVTSQSRFVETDGSLTSFITNKLQLANPGGRTIKAVREALSCFAASSFRFGVMESGHAITHPARSIIENFDIWLPKDGRQRVLFPSFVEYSDAYYNSLLEHAVPLLMEAVAALAHNALALDIYRWLAHRLHRVKPNVPTLLFWNVLHGQFSTPNRRLSEFRAEFKNALAQVLTQYPEAKGKVLIDDENSPSGCKDGRGLWLYHAEPPVRKKQILLP